MFQLIRNDMNIGFVKMRYIGFAVSAVLVTMGLIAIVQMYRGQAKLGVDFAGGSSIGIEFQKPMSSEQLRQAIKDPEFHDVTQQSVTDPGRHKYMLRIYAPQLATEKVSSRVAEVLAKNIPDNPVTILSSEDVGPSVSGFLRQQTYMAIFWAAIGILAYIWIRFDFRFSVAASIATVHDVLSVLGAFYIMGFEINLLLVTALLTIAGYSLNDTVVIFDRIRENVRLRRKEATARTDTKKMDEGYNKIINDSINETLSRTVITNLATFLVVLSLYFFGGEVIHSFAIAMVIGMIVGTYSTIFVAANMVVEWNVHSPMHN